MRSRSAGFLSRRQRVLAWLAFLATAAQAPVVARLSPDASWLFAICVAGVVAVAIIADDLQRRPATRG
jgi:hypothetical protein